MKTASAQNDKIAHTAHRRHLMRDALGLIMLAGAITAIIIAATVEIVGGLVTGAGPSAMTHVIAAMLAIPIGYAVAMTLAVGELARGMDSIVTRIVSEAQLVRAHALQAADAQISTERQRPTTQPTARAVSSAMLSGVLQSVEYEPTITPAQILQPASLQ
jgi:hypothetical protein